jgi:hypothetical protein
MLKRQLSVALLALEEFAQCDLNEQNCSGFQVANTRIQNRAKRALETVEDIEADAKGEL